MAQVSRWFLAHSKDVELPRLELWSKSLAEKLSTDEWPAVITTGRDDYETRAMALGGWERWCDDVPACRKYDGQPMYHGVIVPVDFDGESSAYPHTRIDLGTGPPIVGKATASLVQGFLDQHKHAYAWDIPSIGSSDTFKRILRLDNLDALTPWRAWARLILE